MQISGAVIMAIFTAKIGSKKRLL